MTREHELKRQACLGNRWLMAGYLSVVMAFVTGHAAVLPCMAAASATKTARPAAVTSSHTDDDRAIRAQASEYEKAYAAGDVAALASMFSTNAVYTDDSGRVYRGREAIKEQMSAFFNRSGKQPLEIAIASIDFPSDDTAVEHGTTRLAKSKSPDSTQRYTALHVKRDGKWQMINVTESPYRPTSNSEYLSDLDWIVGNWSAKGANGSLHLTSDWVANKNIIRCEFDTQSNDGYKTSQTEFIFWNPQKHRICSWQYDWSGGCSDAWWERARNAWILHASSLQPDGKTARADYVIRLIDNNTFSWQSTNRRLSGRPLPDTSAIQINRDRS